MGCLNGQVDLAFRMCFVSLRPPTSGFGLYDVSHRRIVKGVQFINTVDDIHPALPIIRNIP